MLKNPKEVKDGLVRWIQNYFAVNGPGCSAVLGISGGKDSTVAAALCVEALGKDRVFGVLMPNEYQHDLQDSFRVIDTLDIRYANINIGDAYSSLVDWIDANVGIREQAQINLPPRLRMATLYAVAQSLPNGGRVVNTCNASEDFVGYSTKYGDAAGDFSPLGNLMVHEVRQIGYELPIPRELVDKVPSDGLCGKTDEDNLGFTYDQLDRLIETGTCGNEEIDLKIQRLHALSRHKYRKMPTYIPFERANTDG